MFLWGVVLLIVGGVIGYSYHYYQVRKEVQELKKQLQHMERFPSEYRLVTHHPHTGLEALVMSFNHTYQIERAHQHQLEQQEQQLREDLGNISHDLRTPLTAIIGYLELIQAEETHTEVASSHLDYAMRRANKLTLLIQNLFFLSKLEQQVLELKQAPLAIDQKLTDILVSHYPLLQSASITIEEVTIHPTPLVSTNAEAVDRIFTNLLLNMIAHGTGTASIEHRKTPQGIVTRFTNGIQPDEPIDLTRIFQRHYTQSHERSQGHAGLGLAICHELVTQLGHTLTATQPTPDTFQIEIIW